MRMVATALTGFKFCKIEKFTRCKTAFLVFARLWLFPRSRNTANSKYITKSKYQ